MKIRSKEGPLLAPLPTVMVSCGTMDESNIITIAWSGIINSNPPMTYVSVQRSRHSHDIIAERGEFVINLTTTELAKAMDFCGVRSGRDIDKFEAAHLTREAADEVSAPMIAESPVNLECKVTEVKSFPSHDMFIAEVLNVIADDRFINPETGALDLKRAGLITYCHGHYYKLGEEIGHFGWTVRKHPKK